ncbi:MAG: hypothetical protein M0038_09150 [Pseudomonadota bacterium]|jgi:hypothetical protein|nr:hypothetical protein [Pseudomonadota bacterium]
MLNTHLLDTPRSAVAAARERLTQAAAALERGRAAHSAAEARIAALADEDARHASAYAERLQQAAVDGVPAVPYLESAPDAAERHRAQIEARGAAEALDRLTAARDAAQADVVTAEAALRETVDQVLDARSCELMELAEQHLRALEAIGVELAALLPDGRFEISSGLASEPAVRELLKRLPTIPRSDIDVPVSELRHGGARASHLAELRTELMSAPVESPVQAAA